MQKNKTTEKLSVQNRCKCYNRLINVTEWLLEPDLACLVSALWLVWIRFRLRSFSFYISGRCECNITLIYNWILTDAFPLRLSFSYQVTHSLCL